MIANTASVSTDKDKNTLFIYDRLDIIGGLETRWMDEFHYLKKNNYKVYFLTPQQRFDSKIAKLFSVHKFITIDIDQIDNAINFIRLVNQIICTIQNEEIDTLSIHMLDTFSFAAVMAAQICKTPVISTVHGILDIYRNPLQRLLVQKLAGRSFSLSVNVSETFESIIPSQQGMTSVIPNLINLNKYQHQITDCKPAWLIVNRISPEKYPSIIRFLQAAEHCHISTVDIAGGGKISELRKHIDNLGIKVQVNFLGEVKDIATLIPHYSGVAGMGRVAIEGLACHKPVCIVSIDGRLIGLVEPENFQNLRKYNFTGKGLIDIENGMLLKQVQKHTDLISQEIYSQLKEELSVKNWDKYIELYNEINFIDNQALESLYHKLSFFSTTLTSPFMHDKFFQHLFYETLIEYKLDDIKELHHYYKESIGLMADYPNPYKVKKAPKWRDKFK